MQLLIAHQLQRLAAVVGLKQAVALRCKVDLQRLDDVGLIVADKDVIHAHTPLFFYYSIKCPACKGGKISYALQATRCDFGAL